MKFLLYFSLIILIISGCRKETPLENDELMPDTNVGPAISIVSPKDADEFQYGEEVLIQWRPQNANINIELYRKTEFKLEIDNNVNRNGEYVWVIPDQMEPSVHYRIKITLRTNPENSVYSEEFTIKGF